MTWQGMAADLTGTSYEWDVSSLPAGSRYRIKIMATGGINTDQDLSDALFAVRQRTYLPLAFKPN